MITIAHFAQNTGNREYIVIITDDTPTREYIISGYHLEALLELPELSSASETRINVFPTDRILWAED